jgi:hypothetical protein
MHWYKKAKLIDKGGPNDPVKVRCMYCGKWATHPKNEKASALESFWKSFGIKEKDKPILEETQTEMSEEDKQDAQAAQEAWNKLNVSSSICPICMEILNDNSRMHPKDVAKESDRRYKLLQER